MTFDEAVRLVVATAGSVGWSMVKSKVAERPLRTPIEAAAKRVLDAAGDSATTSEWFPG